MPHERVQRFGIDGFIGAVLQAEAGRARAHDPVELPDPRAELREELEALVNGEIDRRHRQRPLPECIVQPVDLGERAVEAATNELEAATTGDPVGGESDPAPGLSSQRPDQRPRRAST